MIAEIQVLPAPPGTAQARWSHVDAAIAAVAGSGLAFETGPLGTTLEGPPDAVWETLRAAHEAALASGARSSVSIVKIFEAPHDPLTIEDLTSAHRNRHE
jgi:uncharacterized protein YqgV (UPF0045/DUF77 family)